MKLIILTKNNSNKTKIAVNPKRISIVEPTETGCQVWLEFTSNHNANISVLEDFQTILDMIKNSK